MGNRARSLVLAFGIHPDHHVRQLRTVLLERGDEIEIGVAVHQERLVGFAPGAFEQQFDPLIVQIEVRLQALERGRHDPGSRGREHMHRIAWNTARNDPPVAIENSATGGFNGKRPESVRFRAKLVCVGFEHLEAEEGDGEHREERDQPDDGDASALRRLRIGNLELIHDSPSLRGPMSFTTSTPTRAA